MNLLDKINLPSDIKKLKNDELIELSKEIRRFLVKSISKTGGHLASNLGVVELTVALHYCFDFTKDKIIWDVGHQSYVHKILTGRKDKFDNLRKFKGISGFPKTTESKFDFFDVGHSSTSISVALGFAVARDLLKKDYSVIGLIGDGAITCGLAYEALNNAGRTDTKMIIILNDNEMSISKNVGGITKHLNDIRSAKYYQSAKKDISSFLKSIPKIGVNLKKGIEKVKNTVKYIFVPGVIFEEIGFKYIGPVDGHNIDELIKVINQIKDLEGPVLLHVYTKKGKGYKFAEKNPEKYHAVSAFDIKTGKSLKTQSIKTYSDVFGETLYNMAINDKKIVAITAAMPDGTGLKLFSENLPNRFFDVGIAESHGVTFSAAMARNGFKPFVSIYSTFLQRAYDNIIHDVCIQNLNVAFAIDRSGIVGEDGETHQGIFDIGFLNTMPNMTIIAPKNKNEFIKMIYFARDFIGPIALRYPRGKASDVLEDFKNEIIFSKSEIIFRGSEIAIISVGDMMEKAFECYNKLVTDGYSPTLINLRFIKPIDKEMINSLFTYKYVFVIENHIKSGNTGSIIIQMINDEFRKKQPKIKSFCFPDKFIEHGDTNILFEKYGLDSESLFISIKKFIGAI